MLISTRHQLAYLALPKTGTSSLEAALAPLCDIRFVGSPRAKHMTMSTFERYMLPYLHRIGLEKVETVCVIREPLDWLGSWYRYNSRRRIRREPRSTRDISFAQFIEGYLADPQPPYARFGRPSRFVSGRSGRVTHLYRYEDLPELVRFLGDRFETRLELPNLKVSPPRGDLELPPALRRRLEEERAEDFELYASLGRGK
jgi:hypothetical protein